MPPSDLAGTYTYRSFLDLPQIVGDFGTLYFAEAELRLQVDDDGAVSGMLVFGTSDPPRGLDIDGTATADGTPHLRMSGRGRQGTSLAAYHYEYDGILLPRWPDGIGQRQALAGTVLRAADHPGSGGTVAKAGATASFVAVRRDG